MLGKYPEDGLRLYERWLPDIRPEDLQLMHQPLDFYGQNIYNGICVESDGVQSVCAAACADAWCNGYGLWRIAGLYAYYHMGIAVSDAEFFTDGYYTG